MEGERQSCCSSTGGRAGRWDEGMAEAGQASGQAGKPGAYP